MLYATRAFVDLAAIRHNLAGIRAVVGQRPILAAVKANAYGHGAVAVARMIENTGAADWLGVATVPEAIELRDAGVQLPILKLSHAFPDEVDAALAADLTLTVVDRASIAAVAAGARRRGVAAPVHLKIDTGMRRIGADVGEAVMLAELIDADDHLQLQGLFTHLPAADTPGHDQFTDDQLRRFATVVEDVQQGRGEQIPLVHAANSAGVLAHPDSWFSLVRPGIMIYGHLPDVSTPPSIALRPALSLHSRVSFVKPVAEGESVGYGRTWIAPRDTWVATVPLGYGDGYSRLLSNRGRMLINGVSYPLIGRVCMDQSMIDIGPDPSVSAGEEVVAIGDSGGESITLEEIADLMGTITYEVSCLLTPRVARVHLDDEAGH